MEEIEGSIEKIIFHSEESGWTVARLAPSDPNKKERSVRSTLEGYTVVGNFAHVQLGENYFLKGQWIKHPKFGSQFQMSSYEVKTPATLDGIEKYLSSGLIKGIGPITARRIVNRFGLDTLEILDESAHRLREISGIGREKSNAIIKAWNEQKSIRNVMLFLQQHGISPNYAVKIFKRYGERAIEVVKENPYRLAQDIYGIGFQSADKIAMSLGFSQEDSRRFQAGLTHTLKTSSTDGHCYLPQSKLIDLAAELLNISNKTLLVAQLPNLLLESLISWEQDRIALPELFRAEKSLATDLNTLIATPPYFEAPLVEQWLIDYESKKGVHLSEEQKNAVVLCTTQPCSILTGGPGTGKTTTTKAIVDFFEAQDKHIQLASPTGRAAQRLGEVVGRAAKTLHRLLEFDPATGEFQKNKENPLECELLIVDEVSMLDVLLASALLEATPVNCQLVFVGDADQLPSVGPGNVLRDLLNSPKVKSVRLTQVFRQAKESQIIQAAHQINQGEFPRLIAPGELKSDFYFLKLNDPKDILRTVTKLVSSSIPKKFNFDPIKEIQVLCPMNRGPLGITHLNEVLQTTLNPDESAKVQIKRQDRIFRQGDKVIQRVNNYDLGVFNGDLGLIESIDLEEEVLRVDFEDRLISYEFSQLSELSLAYAISIHKSQGSEFQCIVVPIHTQHFILLNRNLIYTALTRGKALVVFVGMEKAMQLGITRLTNLQRYTRLKTLMESPFEIADALTN